MFILYAHCACVHIYACYSVFLCIYGILYTVGNAPNSHSPATVSMYLYVVHMCTLVCMYCVCVLHTLYSLVCLCVSLCVLYIHNMCTGVYLCVCCIFTCVLVCIFVCAVYSLVCCSVCLCAPRSVLLILE